MIIESIYWRRDLYRAAATIHHKATQKIWRESSTAILEMRLTMGAFAVRKLMESTKVPDNMQTDRLLPCVEMQPRPVTLERFRYSSPIDIIIASEMFSFAEASLTSISMRSLINQLIHSDIVIHLPPEETETGEMALLVSSDHEKRKRLFGVWYWSEKDNDHRRMVSKGELDDRLVAWGYASAEAVANSVGRIRNPRNGPSLEDVLRRIGREIGELETE